MRSARNTLPALVCATALLAAPGAHAETGALLGGDAEPQPRATAVAAKRPAVTVNGRVLTVTGTRGSDRVVVICHRDGFVRVNKKAPDTGIVKCSDIVEVDVVAGPGNDRVDLSGVNYQFGQANFPDFGTGVGAAGLLGPGKDHYVGSRAGFNLVYGNAGADTARGGKWRDTFTGGSGDDKLIGLGGKDVLLGKAGADRLLGGAGGDLLSGNAGDDILAGQAGADLLGGGGGNDTLIGGPGNDRLFGGHGKDRLRGGGGRDAEQQDPPGSKKKGK
jgi:Ca2+-binding RTX toxin-like protein